MGNTGVTKNYVVEGGALPQDEAFEDHIDNPSKASKVLGGAGVAVCHGNEPH